MASIIDSSSAAKKSEKLDKEEEEQEQQQQKRNSSKIAIVPLGGDLQRESLRSNDSDSDDEQANDNVVAKRMSSTQQHQQQQQPIRQQQGGNNNENNNENNDNNKKKKNHKRNSLLLAIGADENDWAVQDAHKFDELVIDNITTLEESIRILRRTRAVTVMANKLMLAENEQQCFEEVGRMLVALFQVERSTYALMTDPDHFTVLTCSVSKKEYTKELCFEFQAETGMRRMPLKGTGIGHCAETLEILYTPNSLESPFMDHQKIAKMQIKTILNVPILVHGRKFAGCLNIGFKEKDAFSCQTTTTTGNANANANGNNNSSTTKNQNLILIQDIATTLGAHVYSKRLQKAEEESYRVSRELLHSLIPPRILTQIEHFWQESNVKHNNNNNNHSNNNNKNDTTTMEQQQQQQLMDNDDDDDDDDDDDELDQRFNIVRERLELLENINRQDASAQSEFLGLHLPSTQLQNLVVEDMNNSSSSGDGGGGGGVGDCSMRDINNMNNSSFSNLFCLGPADTVAATAAPTRALYAENRSNVSIVFTDIVGFSRIALNMDPMKVMDMLQDLFHRFDCLCDKHGVQKLETIGDAYICAAGLFDDDDDDHNDNDNNDNAAAGGSSSCCSRNDCGRSAAVRALAMAKDMVREARNVLVPAHNNKKQHQPKKLGQGRAATAAAAASKNEYLQIRAGIHVGDVTCGILGQRQPKFSVFGNAMNLAARMEQTSIAGKIQVTEAFHDLVGDLETEWEEERVVHLKNMGEVDTFLLDPIYSRVERY